MTTTSAATQLRQIADEIDSIAADPKNKGGGGHLPAARIAVLVKRSMELEAFAHTLHAPMRVALTGITDADARPEACRSGWRAYRSLIAAASGLKRVVPFNASAIEGDATDRGLREHAAQLAELVRMHASDIELKSSPQWPTILALSDLGAAICEVYGDWRDAGAYFDLKGGVEAFEWPEAADADRPRMESMAREWTERDRAEAAARGEDPALVSDTNYNEPRGAALIRQFQESFGRLGPALRKATAALAATAKLTDGGETRPAERWSVKAILRLGRLRGVGALDVPTAALGPFRLKEWKPPPALSDTARAIEEMCRELRAMAAAGVCLQPPASGDGAGEGDFPPPVDYVTLKQASGVVQKSKRTLQGWLEQKKLPPPDIRGVAGRSNEWSWSRLRGPLEEMSGKRLPAEFPGHKFPPKG